MANEFNYWLGTTDGDWNTAANWSEGTVPAATENVRIPNDATRAILGFLASAVELSSFVVEDGCSIQIGGGSTGIPLTLDVADAGNTNIGGTGKIFLSGDLKILNISGGAKKVDIDENATLATVSMTAKTAMRTQAAITTANISDGSKLIHGVVGETSTSITTAVVDGVSSSLLYNSSGTITAVTVRAGGRLDGSGDSRATTITTMNLYGGGSRIIDPYGRFAFTNKIDLKEGAVVTAA